MIIILHCRPRHQRSDTHRICVRIPSKFSSTALSSLNLKSSVRMSFHFFLLSSLTEDILANVAGRSSCFYNKGGHNIVHNIYITYIHIMYMYIIYTCMYMLSRPHTSGALLNKDQRSGTPL